MERFESQSAKRERMVTAEADDAASSGSGDSNTSSESDDDESAAKKKARLAKEKAAREAAKAAASRKVLSFVCTLVERFIGLIDGLIDCKTPQSPAARKRCAGAMARQRFTTFFPFLFGVVHAS